MFLAWLLCMQGNGPALFAVAVNEGQTIPMAPGAHLGHGAHKVCMDHPQFLWGSHSPLGMRLGLSFGLDAGDTAALGFLRFHLCWKALNGLGSDECLEVPMAHVSQPLVEQGTLVL